MAPARGLLKARDLPFSASSWDDLWENRILPAYREGAVTDLDLANLLREEEETGRQHIFLYCCEPETARRPPPL